MANEIITFSGTDFGMPSGTTITLEGIVNGGSIEILGTTTTDDQANFSLRTTVSVQDWTSFRVFDGTSNVDVGVNSFAELAITANNTIAVSDKVFGIIGSSGGNFIQTHAVGDVFTPFSGVTITDTLPAEQISVTISGDTTDFIDVNTGKPIDFSVTGTAAEVTAALDAFEAQEVASPNPRGVMFLNIFDASGSGQFIHQDTLEVTAPIAGSITGFDTVDPTSAPVTKNSTVKPFAHATVSDTSSTETLKVQVSVASGYSTSSDTTFIGTADQVTQFLDNFSAKALQNGPGIISASITNPNAPGLAGGKVLVSFTFNGTAPGGSGLHSPMAGQLCTLSGDVMQFYNDQKAGSDTAADLSKLTGDLSGLALSKPNLAQLLTAALQGDAVSDAGALGKDLANMFYGTINGDMHSQSPSLGADLTAMVKEAVAVGGTYAADLAATGSASKALAQTIAQFHLS